MPEGTFTHSPGAVFASALAGLLQSALTALAAVLLQSALVAAAEASSQPAFAAAESPLSQPAFSAEAFSAFSITPATPTPVVADLSTLAEAGAPQSAFSAAVAEQSAFSAAVAEQSADFEVVSEALAVFVPSQSEAFAVSGFEASAVTVAEPQAVFVFSFSEVSPAVNTKPVPARMKSPVITVKKTFFIRSIIFVWWSMFFLMVS